MSKKGARDHVKTGSILVFGTCLAFFFLNSILSYNESKWAIPLFAFPLIVQGLGLIVLYRRPPRDKAQVVFYRFYLITMASCLLGYFTMWCLYFIQHSISNSLSYLVLAYIAFLLALVIRMTQAIRKGTSRFVDINHYPLRWRAIWNLDYLALGVSQEPNLALLLFFMAFIGVSYLFGFAFAFHDKSQPPQSPGLYKANLNLNGAQNSRETINIDQSHYIFYFDVGRALPDIEDVDLIVMEPRTNKRDVAERRKQNHDSLKEIINVIKRATGDYTRIRIVLIGRADEFNLKGSSYESNHALSAARAEGVKQIIQDGLSRDGSIWRNIEWSSLPASNEPSFNPLSSMDKFGRPVSKNRDEHYNNRIVEAFIDPIPGDPTALQMQHLLAPSFSRLELLDYMYFSILTITTTGYGDIFPVTGYARVLSSLASICQVFLFVVVFNAVLSLKQENVSAQDPKV